MPKHSDISGLLLLDKPVGWSSNAALGKVRRLFGGAKGGHTGTLDPFASGLLPITLGEAGKFSRFLLDANKRYFATVRLGWHSSTGDVEGELRAEGHIPEVTDQAIKVQLQDMVGEQSQIPPMHSAIKRDGVPLYELARKGIEVPREARTIRIFALDLIDRPGMDSWQVDVHCSKGTYVRVLAEDIGRRFGCGAYLTDLRRTAVGDLHIGQAITIEELEALDESGRNARLLPAGRLVSGLPAVYLDVTAARMLLDGQHPFAPEGPDGPNGEISVWGPQESFLGVAVRKSGRTGKVLVPVRLMSPNVLP
jgi:tRNA pseudouridine55 synthase